MVVLAVRRGVAAKVNNFDVGSFIHRSVLCSLKQWRIHVVGMETSLTAVLDILETMVGCEVVYANFFVSCSMDYGNCFRHHQLVRTLCV